jgi:ketosteroid isomerase-like protein
VNDSARVRASTRDVARAILLLRTSSIARVAASFSLVGTLFGCAPAASPLPTAGDRCAVWDRENGFSKAVADHDLAAFAEFVHPRAVFAGDTVLRGRDEVVKGWTPIVKGEGVSLVWHPTSADLVDARTAVTRGPFWLTITKPGQEPAYEVGTFQSTWLRGDDGVWRVAIDGGAAPKPATLADVKKVEASVTLACQG